eukprot:15457382-Alexandrium_andersonii.AAC.1
MHNTMTAPKEPLHTLQCNKVALVWLLSARRKSLQAYAGMSQVHGPASPTTGSTQSHPRPVSADLRLP